MVRLTVAWERGLKRSALPTLSARVAVHIFIAISLLAITIGFLAPKFVPKRRVLTAFDEVGPGRVKGNLCTNDFFGFSVRFPRGWHTRTRASLKRFLEHRKKSDRRNVAVILAAFKIAHGTRDAETFNPSLVVGADRLSNLQALSGAREFLLRAVQERESDGLYYGAPNAPYKWGAGKEVFFRVDGKRALQGKIVNTSHLAVIKKGYAFSIALAWESEEDGKVLAEALNTVRFE